MQKTELSRKIEVKKRGNKIGFWFFKVSLHFFGLRGAYGLLYIVCLYYVIFDHSAVSLALAYIKRRFRNHGSIRRCVHVYRLFVSQGKQLIDRYAILAREQMFDMQIQGDEQFMELVRNSNQGVILLTSHFGNWQVAMTTLKKIDKTVYLLMRPEENLAVQSSLYVSREQGNIKIVSPEQHLGGVVEIMNLLKEGHIVSIMGDRSYGSRTVEVSFLGEKAYFPYGAFSIAASTGCPVVVLLSVKESPYRYVVDISNVFYPYYEKEQDKRQQLRQWIQNFVTLLDTYVGHNPYQCFLFHDVWREETENRIG